MRFGIRHHGPGCARALVAALEATQPAAVLIEGPQDAEGVIAQAGDELMQPPVAMLVYPVDNPGGAVSYPMATFSPEWQAIRWAIANDRPAHFIDLPLSLRPPEPPSERPNSEGDDPNSDGVDTNSDGVDTNSDGVDTNGDERGATGGAVERPPEPVRVDPLGVLSEAAGYDDPELWWEHQVERRADASGLFAGIAEAMEAIREAYPEEDSRTLDREAFMRQSIRRLSKTIDGEAAIVVGAWHLPALSEAAVAGRIEGCRIKDDTARLKGRKKQKTTATWIPWTSGRLAYASGYGAGIASPGWYEHVWNSTDHAPTRWVVEAARLLRTEDLDASSASVIETVRTAESLSILRNLRTPGLAELREAMLAVLCHGSEVPMELIRRKLEVGDRFGEVPETTPTVPLQQSLTQEMKTLRLKPTADQKQLDLDLRTDSGRARSHLLHRLRLLDIPWGDLVGTGSQKGTFRESWQIGWQPEFAVRVIEANVYGGTPEAAATGRVHKLASDPPPAEGRLTQLSELLDGVLLADLPKAATFLLEKIDAAAAESHDVRHLLGSLLPLARIARYGDVRGTAAADVRPVVETLFERAVVGLPSAAQSLDDGAAEELIGAVDRASEAITLLDRDDLRDRWLQVITKLSLADLHPLLVGRCVRMRLDAAAIDDAELARLARLALSSAVPPEAAANWATGLMRGPGLVLLHKQPVWDALDGWIRSIPEDRWPGLAVLLRRALADFSGPERRQIGELVKSLGQPPSGTAGKRAAAPTTGIDHERAAKVLPVLRVVLGTG